MLITKYFQVLVFQMYFSIPSTITLFKSPAKFYSEENTLPTHIIPTGMST